MQQWLTFTTGKEFVWKYTQEPNLQPGKTLQKNGLTVRVHGNVKRLPSGACSAKTVERIVKFIKNTAEEQALLLPGCVPGFKQIDVKLLNWNLTKHRLWKQYSHICTSIGQVSVGYSKFCDLWSQLCQFILIMRPATDLCWTCQKNSNWIHRSANSPKTGKAEAVRAQQEHLRFTSGERKCYKNCCEESTQHVQHHFEEVDCAYRREPLVLIQWNCTLLLCLYAQQLHYPSNPNQPGAIYFKTPRKCTFRRLLRGKLSYWWECNDRQRSKQHNFARSLFFWMPWTRQK